MYIILIYICVTKANNMNTIEKTISELKALNQDQNDLNSFAGMKTIKEERMMILKEWAKISQQRESVVKTWKNK